MFCRSCGAQISDTAKFCGKCGTQTLNAGAPVATSQDAVQIDDEVTIEQAPVPENPAPEPEATVAQVDDADFTIVQVPLGQATDPEPSPEEDESLQDPFLSLDAQFFDPDAENGDDDDLGDISDPLAAFEMALAHAAEGHEDAEEGSPNVTMEASFFQPEETSEDNSAESAAGAQASQASASADTSAVDERSTFEAEFFKVESSFSTSGSQPAQNSASDSAPERDFAGAAAQQNQQAASQQAQQAQAAQATQAQAQAQQAQAAQAQAQAQRAQAQRAQAAAAAGAGVVAAAGAGAAYGNAQRSRQQQNAQVATSGQAPRFTPDSYATPAQQADADYDTTAEEQQESAGGRTIAIILAIVAVIAAVAIGIFAFMYFNPIGEGGSGTPGANSSLDTEKTGEMVSFMQGEWDCADGPKPCIYVFTEDAATIKDMNDVVITTGPYYLKDDRLGIYDNGSDKTSDIYTAVLEKEDENTVSLTDKSGTVSLRRIDTDPNSNSEQELMKKLIGYWEGIDNEGQVPITQEFLADGTCIIGYHGVENADSGKYWVEGDVLYIQGHLVEEPYNYRIQFLNDGKTMIQTNVDSQSTVHLNRAVKSGGDNGGMVIIPTGASAA